jgi:hypothetical protein
MARCDVLFGPFDDVLVEERDRVPEGVGLEISVPIPAAIFSGDADLEDGSGFGDFADAAQRFRMQGDIQNYRIRFIM